NISNCDIRNASSYNNLDVSHCTALKTINASGNAGNGMTYFQASDLPSGVEEIDLSGCPKLVMTTQYTQLTSKVANSLKTLDVSNCDIVNTPASFSGLTALETLRIGTNPKIASLDVSNVNNLETLDITNNTGMTSLTAKNCKLSSLSLSGCTSLTHVDVSNNQFSDMSFVSGSNVSWLDISQNNITGIPANNDNNCPLQTLKMNNSGVTSIANASTYPNLQYLYVQNNNFGADYTLNGNSQLAGLAISNAAANTALTSFTATNNTLLEALDLSGNNSLETLNLHGNSALTKTTATVNDIEGGGGLYIKGLANLQTLDISNSSFNLIGQNNSLLGTGIKTLKASHNNFKTFTNSNYDVGGPSGTTNHRAASDVANKPSLEDLTALEYLDLSYNAICDSVHLYHNTILKHLDVSHNQILGPLPTTQAETDAMIQKKVMCAVKYSAHHMGQDKTRGISQAYSTAMRDHRRTEDIDGTYRYYDFRPCDLRDTIGIFHLDLQFNTNLEYLDFSSTNIHNTAAGRIYMCPGWERTASTGDDPTSNWNDFVTSGTAYTEYGSTKHHFVWFQNCQKLKVIKADNNNMQSLGISYFPDLDSISCAGMYGDCNFMNDGRGPGNGNKGFPNGMYVYDHSETVLENGVYTETTYYRGVDGTVAKANEIPVSNRYPSKITYANFSNGDFYYINPYYATAIVSLDISNNPLQGSTSAYTNKPLDISHCSNIENLNARGCTTINQINAYGLNELETIDVTGSTGLKILRAYDCPKLYHQDQAEFITGLNTCPDLEEIWISNDNIKSLNLDNNTKLKTVKVYDNDQLPALDVTMLSDLENLDAARCKLSELDLSLNTKLRTLDVSNTAKPTSLGENGTNKLSDIVISSPDIESINAAYNNLYCISGLANRTALAALDISHNHINGIDLSGCTNLATINDIDNGRKIVAEYNVVSKKVGNTVTNYDVYFFQTDATAAENEGQTYLSDRTSTDVLKGTQRGDLAIDGFDITKVNGWTSGGTTYTGSKGSAGAPRRSNTPFDPSDADDILDPTKVAGTLVLLDADQPTAEYSYNNGLTTSTYYLEWEAPSTPTAVNDITADEFTATGGTGAILVQSPQDVEVIIVDMSGRIIAQNLIEAGSFTFTDIAPGIYLVNGIKVTVK
ncbi:MAG: hypothetical protein IK092_02600, partial [Muribaculaceae bacterium]|nr:hypothetical protein [Muribaculaceae bacterium]